ncbi:MAG: glycosyltransferase family 4 protein [Candidatus Omnitrophica bacterium]|nr:glycosyltransferase family 4 protein [Candidatus Omnitrophota bacterium]
MRLLCLIPHPIEGQSSRYRVLQYVPHLEAAGISCTVSSFVSPTFYKILYEQGRWVSKLGYAAMGVLRRVRDVLRSSRYDAVFIHLEACPVGPPIFEWCLSRRGPPVIFDLDDAIFLSRRSAAAPPGMGWLRRPNKVEAILRWSRSVIACNDYLADFARQWNSRVYMIPTCVDTERFTPAPKPPHSKPVVGWVGSPSTASYLLALRRVLQRVAERHPFSLKIVGAGSAMPMPGVEVVQEPWTMARDVACFQELDVGLYPLPDEEWVLGKTGFKTVQYLSVGAPCVASRIGRNCEIIEDGVNGFLAGSEEEWVEKLTRLLLDPALRERLGQAGRRTVEERYSVRAHAAGLIAALRDTVNGHQ